MDGMEAEHLRKLAGLSPFELKDELIGLASRNSERLMLNAGRGNPNWLVMAPRYGFWQLGLFAMDEAQRHFGHLPEIGGLPDMAGMEARFETFVRNHEAVPGVGFLNGALAYARDQLGLPADRFLHEMVRGVLGCQYPTPPRMLPLSEIIIRHFLRRELGGGRPLLGSFRLFATEGASAAMTYVFNSLRENGLLVPGDRVALVTPIFTPYLEIPGLDDYQLTKLEIRTNPDNGWQIPDAELQKLRDPSVKALLLVNPNNPTSVKLSDTTLGDIERIVAGPRPDLIILSDDVYAGFADDFTSLFAVCPHNTLLVYSYSKYFGATGWRLGAVCLHEDNVLDRRLAALPGETRDRLSARYGSLSLSPGELGMIDRMVADSRSVALNHTAGLSSPQQVQMVLFSLYGLMDEDDHLRTTLRRLVRQRHRTLFAAIGLATGHDPDSADYYTELDLEALANRIHGPAFATWLLRRVSAIELLCRLAEEAGVVLLPGKGFGDPYPSARISLANLNDYEYRAVGRAVRKLLDDYHAEFTG